MKSTNRPIIAGSLCVIVNYVVVLIVYFSSWGTIFMLDDQFSRSNVVVPVAAGLMLGCIQTAIFGSRVTLLAALVGLVGVATLLLTYTLLTQAVGIVVGNLAVLTIRASWRQFHPSDAGRPSHVT